MKKITLLLVLIGLSGCAQTMTIPDEKLGEEQATLTINASALKGYVSIPLINSKVVNVYLSEFPECIDGKLPLENSDVLGKSTLTPSKNIQKINIPSGNKVLISTNSNENAGGNVYTCWNSLHFTPEVGQNYELEITPHKSLSSEKCRAVIYQLESQNRMKVESATYPEVIYKGFWKGKVFDHCAG